MPNAIRSTSVRVKPREYGQTTGDGVYDHGSNAPGPRADGEAQESLLAEKRELGNNLAERKVESACDLGGTTGGGSVNATISMCKGLLAGTGVFRERKGEEDLCERARGGKSRRCCGPSRG